MLEQLGPYRFENVLGRGGMGTVFRGIHSETDACQAVKVLAPQYADDEHFRGRFESEIEAMMKLAHPNIVRLISHGQESGNLYFAMELVEGKSLYDLQRGGHRFLWPECLRIAADVCRGLKHAHDRGIIHRDLKPGNLLMTKDKVVKITDFGIAKSYGDSHHTGTNILGTMDFMAPEQAKGEPVTARSDIYALGTVMYTLMTGKPPFSANSMEESFRNLTRVPVPKISTRVANIPAEVEDLLSKMLDKNPQKRIPTALATLNKILAVQDHLKYESEAKTTHQVVDESPSAKTINVSRPSKTVILKTNVSPGPRNENVTRVLNDASVTRVDPTSIGKNQKIANTDAVSAAAKEKALKGGGKARKTLKKKKVTGKKVESFGEDYFKPVTEADRVALQSDGVDEPSEKGRWLLATLLLVTVAVAGVATMLVFQGPSADELYGTIQDAYETPEDVIVETDDFLVRFKTDSRFGEVELLNQIGKSVKNYVSLVKRLSVRARIPGDSRLTQIEDQFLKIVDLAEDSPKAADAKMVAFIDVHSGRENLAKRDRECVEAAEGFRIKIVGAEKRKIDLRVANFRASMQRAADATPLNAAQVYRSLIKLYGDDDWGESDSVRLSLLQSCADELQTANEAVDEAVDAQSEAAGDDAVKADVSTGTDPSFDRDEIDD